MLLFEDEDKRELLEEVSIYDVLDFIGVEYRNAGCRKSILCPDRSNHHDEHYGSCYIYENTNTVHCFVCNKSFDAIELLRLNGYSYYDALCTLAELSGSPSRFEKQPERKQFHIPKLTKEQRKLIGLYPERKRIKLYTSIQENKPDIRDYDIIFSETEDEDTYLPYKTLGYNPWIKLQKENPEWYLSLVLHKCMETMERYYEFYEENKEQYSPRARKLFRKEMGDKFNQAKEIGLIFQKALTTYHRELQKGY